MITKKGLLIDLIGKTVSIYFDELGISILAWDNTTSDIYTILEVSDELIKVSLKVSNGNIIYYYDTRIISVIQLI